MLLLKGPVRKSIVCQSILDGNQSVLGVQYCSPENFVPTLRCAFVDISYHSQEDFGLELFNHRNYQFILIYTDKKEEQLKELKKYIEKFEKKTNVTVILACK